MDCSMPGFPGHHQLPELAQTHTHWVSDTICRPLLLPPSISPSSRVFSNELALPIRWPKFGNFSFSPSNEYSGLISFRMDWLDLLAVRGTLKSLLQHHSSKASIHWCLVFFMVQLSNLYMITGKTKALTIWIFVGKWCLCFLMTTVAVMSLSRFEVAFLPRGKCLLISWLQLPSAETLEPKKIKSVTVSTFSPSICHEVRGPDAMSLIFWMLSFQPAFLLSCFTFIKRLFKFFLAFLKLVFKSQLNANSQVRSCFFFASQKLLLNHDTSYKWYWIIRV